jgi:hypothetical protein
MDHNFSKQSNSNHVNICLKLILESATKYLLFYSKNSILYPFSGIEWCFHVSQQHIGRHVKQQKISFIVSCINLLCENKMIDKLCSNKNILPFGISTIEDQDPHNIPTFCDFRKTVHNVY